MIRLHGWIQTQLACLSGAGAVLLLAATLGVASPALAQSPEDPSDDLFSDEVLGEEDDLFADDEELFEAAPGPEEAEPSESASDAAPPPQADAADAPPRDAPPVADAIPPPAIEASSGPDEAIEEILIQGQSSQAVEIDAAASVTSFDADDLAAMGVEDVADVAQYTPNLEIRTAGSTTPTFFIRGVGLNDFTANASGSVATGYKARRIA